MTAAAAIVDDLLEADINPDDMLRDVNTMFSRENRFNSLAKIGNIQVSFGVFVHVGDEDAMEDSAREDGVVLDWDTINKDIVRVEQNALNILGKNGIAISGYAHDSFGDLVGTGWLRTKMDASSISVALNTVGIDIVRLMLDAGEPLSTSSGSFSNLKGAEDLFKYVSEQTARYCDVSIGIFDTDKLTVFYDLLDSDTPVEDIAAQIASLGESFLAPPEPSGIFRKIVNGVEIYSARCPGCKRIHGNFRYYDQAAGNRQCKYCNRDFVDKMMKVSTTGNFKHLLKKDHEARASKSYR